MLNKKYRITGVTGIIVVILAALLGPDFIEALRIAVMATSPAI